MSQPRGDRPSPLPRASVDLRDRQRFVDYISTSREIVPKDQLLVSLARGRKVLDLGCIDHSADTALGLGTSWLHSQLRDAADELVGIDLLAGDAATLNERGYDIRVGDVEHLDLGETFDLAIAGDLIEHLSNPGLFLDSVARHLEPTSAFVITTPNPFNAEQFAQALFRNQIMANAEHTMWLDPRVMHELVSRSPFEIADFKWIDTRFHFVLKRGRFVRRVVNPLTRAAIRYRPILGRDFAVVLTLSGS
jgi:SAM-dependent methyltransferase